MSLIDSVKTIVYRNYLKTLKASAFSLLVGLGSLSGAPVALAQTPPPIGSQVAAAPRSEANRWIVMLEGTPTMQLQQRDGVGKHTMNKTDLAKHQADLGRIRAQFLAESGYQQRGKTGPRTFETLIHGMVLTGNHDDAAFWRTLPMVKGVYANRRLQVKPMAQTPAAKPQQVAADSVYDGSGQVIAVIDTGVDYTHPDLGGGLGPDYKVIGGFDFVDDDNDPMDGHYHGTHVAGIAAADGNLQGQAPKAKILAYRVLNSEGEGSEDDVIAGIEAAVNPDGDVATDDGADVINLSLGGPGHADDPLCQAVDAAVEAGAVVVAAAGNEGNFAWRIGSPGAARDAITVGALHADGAIAYYSSYGPARPAVAKPDLTALGDVVSTFPGGHYVALEGTSMAAPAVAGMAALVRQARPDLSAKQIKATLLMSADAVDGARYFEQGRGQVNLERALQQQMVADRASLDFGRVDYHQDTLTVTKTFQVTNGGTESQTLKVTPFAAGEGLAMSVSPTEQVTEPGESATFTLTLSVDNNAWPFLRQSHWLDQRELMLEMGEERRPFAVSAGKYLEVSLSQKSDVVALSALSAVDADGKQISVETISPGMIYRTEPGPIDLLVSALSLPVDADRSLFLQNFRQEVNEDTALVFDEAACRIPFEHRYRDVDGSVKKVSFDNRIGSRYGWYKHQEKQLLAEPYSWKTVPEAFFSHWPVRHDFVFSDAVSLGGDRVSLLTTSIGAVSGDEMPLYDMNETAAITVEMDLAHNDDKGYPNYITAMATTNEDVQLFGANLMTKLYEEGGEILPYQVFGPQKMTMLLPNPEQWHLPQCGAQPVRHIRYSFTGGIDGGLNYVNTVSTPHMTFDDQNRLVRAQFTEDGNFEPSDELVATNYVFPRTSPFPVWGAFLETDGLKFLFNSRQYGGFYLFPYGGSIAMANGWVFEKDGEVIGTDAWPFLNRPMEAGAYRITTTGISGQEYLGQDVKLTLECQFDPATMSRATAPVLQTVYREGDQLVMAFYDRDAAIAYQNYQTDLEPEGHDPSALEVTAAVRNKRGGEWEPLTVSERAEGVFAVTLPEPALDETLSLRVRAVDADGDAMTYESPAYLSHGLVSVLPQRINDTSRFSALSLVNHGLQRRSLILEAHDQNGRRDQRTFSLRAGERKERIVASLFPRLNDYSLRLVQAGDDISMALETWPVFGGGAKTQAVAAHKISQAQRLTFVAGGEDALLSFGAIFDAGDAPEASTVDVTLWHGDAPIASSELALEDDRRVEIGFADLFPGVEIKGPFSLFAKSRDQHKLSLSYRTADGIVTGSPDVVGLDIRRWFVLPPQVSTEAASLVLVNRDAALNALQLRAYPHDGGAVVKREVALTHGTSQHKLADLFAGLSDYSLEISNGHGMLDCLVLVPQTGNQADLRLAPLEGWQIAANVQIDDVSVIDDTRILVAAPDAAVDTEVVMILRDAFNRPIERTLLIPAGESLTLTSDMLLRLGFPRLDGTTVAFSSPTGVNLAVIGYQQSLFGPIRVLNPRKPVNLD